MPVQIRISAADLVIGNDRPAVFAQRIEQLEVIVRRAGAAVQQKERRLSAPPKVAGNPKVGFISAKGHVAFCNLYIRHFSLSCINLCCFAVSDQASGWQTVISLFFSSPMSQSSVSFFVYASSLSR